MRPSRRFWGRPTPTTALLIATLSAMTLLLAMVTGAHNAAAAAAQAPVFTSAPTATFQTQIGEGFQVAATRSTVSSPQAR